MANKNTLELDFDEAETIERYLSSYENHSHLEETKAKPPEKEPKDINHY